MIRGVCLGSEDEVCDPGQLERMFKIRRDPELKGDASADRHRLHPGFRKAVRLATERSGPNGHVSEIVVNQLVRENARWVYIRLVAPRVSRCTSRPESERAYSAHGGVVGTHGLARWMDVAMTRLLGRRMKPITVT